MKKRAKVGLRLARETIRSLQGGELHRAAGGDDTRLCPLTRGCPPPVLTDTCPSGKGC